MHAERDRIDTEILQIERDGQISKYQPAQIRERFSTAVSLLRQLQGDFRAVEDSFREITAQVQQRQQGGADIVADVSQPRGVSASLNHERPNAKLVTTGLVRLPADPAFRLTPHTPPGKCFACAAEAVLMGLERVAHPLCGSIDLDAVETMQRLALKHALI